VAHGDDILLLPDLEHESAGSPVEDGIGAVVERVERGTTPAVLDLDGAATEEISWKLAQQLATRIVPG
jgi:hypothetical protein